MTRMRQLNALRLPFLSWILMTAAGLDATATQGSAKHWPREQRVPSMFGLALCDLGDVTGDGVADLAISDPLADQVWVVSGSDWQPVTRIEAVHTGLRFGETLASAGDLNGDGTPDLLIGACPEAGEGGEASPTVYAHVYAYSGADWSELYEVDIDSKSGGANSWYSSGSWPQMCSTGDIDADGNDDFAVGVPYDDAGGSNAGKVLLVSGNSGALIRTLSIEVPNACLGTAIVSLPDIDGDGSRELAISANPSIHPRHKHSNELPGCVYIVSPASGKVLSKITGPGTSPGFGSSLAVGPDRDGGGSPDIFVGQSFTRNAQLVALMSTETGLPLQTWHFRGESNMNADVPSFGVKVVLTADLNMDGCEDVLITQPSSFGGPYSAAVYSGKQDAVEWSLPIIRGLSHFGVEALRIHRTGALATVLVVSAASWRGNASFPGVVQIYDESSRERVRLLTKTRLEAALSSQSKESPQAGKQERKAARVRHTERDKGDGLVRK
ncbi:MAG: hypothetical protein ACI841_000092 [Planctomycetota bacterium]|jgi:hypothetical protein